MTSDSETHSLRYGDCCMPAHEVVNKMHNLSYRNVPTAMHSHGSPCFCKFYCTLVCPTA